MKHTILTLRTRHGEYEFNDISVHEVPEETVIEDWADMIASMQYAEDDYDMETDEWSKIPGEREDEFESEVYFFNGGELAVKVASVREISKEHYEILNQYL